MLQWLSFGLFFARYGATQSAYISLGRPEYITAINVTKLISLYSIVPALFYLFGLEGAIIGIAFHMLPSTAWMFYFNRQHGLNKFSFELWILSTWVLGWLFGFGFVEVIKLIK